MMAHKKERSILIFYVNGKKIADADVDPETTLLQYLRLKRLTGVKYGCGEGGCGACTVMISRFNRNTKTIRHFSAMACLYRVCDLHGASVTTVEGLGSVKRGLHPIQERMAKSYGAQCGFCTPGIVMSVYALLRNNPTPTKAQLEKELEGNLCRCTGYRSILDGLEGFTKECSMGEQCCRRREPVEEGMATVRFDSNEFSPYDPTQDPIFPPELQICDTYDLENLCFIGERVTLYRPVTLIELFSLIKAHPGAKLVNGNTDIGIKSKTTVYPVIISVTRIPELNFMETTEDSFTVGSSVTLTQLEDTLIEMKEDLPSYKTHLVHSLLWILSRFANCQSKNVATIAGNIMSASADSDLSPLLLAMKAKLTFMSPGGVRSVTVIDDKFFRGYHETANQSNQLLAFVEIPFTKKHEYVEVFKQSVRRTCDAATVNAAMRVVLHEDSDVVEDVSIYFGGMAATVVSAKSATTKAKGRKWDEGLLSDVCEWLKTDLPLAPGSPGGVTEYRLTLALSFFFRFYHRVQEKHQKQVGKSEIRTYSQTDESAVKELIREVSRGMVVYEEVAPGQSDADPVGRNILPSSAPTHTTGETVYLDDLPTYTNELHLARVTSTRAHAKILKVDPSKALDMPGVVDFISHTDVPGSNLWGIEEADEELFASSEVFSQGQTIAAIVADTKQHALVAARAVEITYEDLDVVLSIEDARKKDSFYDRDRLITCGDVDAAFNEADHVLEGNIHVGGQEHFYIEPQCCIAVPLTEYSQMEVITSSQWVSKAQTCAATALGVPENRVICKAKRLGGAFGGKVSRPCVFVGVSVVAANKTGRPVRCVLEREEDTASVGSRHPYLGSYKVGFTSNGRITSLDLEFFGNAGFSLDVSGLFVDKGLYHACNAYNVPNVRVKGRICKTNITSNVSMRSFATFPLNLTAENWINDVAIYLGISPIKVREINMHKEGELTYFSQKLTNYYLPRCWVECLKLSEYHNRRRAIDQYNSANRWKKRGIAMTNVLQGLSNVFLPANQAGALVHIYQDGSVMLAFGGSEMGQSLFTKMIQIASRVLGIPIAKIHIAGVSTETVPNNSPSGASISSDINGMAIMTACRTLMDRLDHFVRDNPKGTWEDWVAAAYEDRVSLSTTGFYKVPDLGCDEKTRHGTVFNYFTTGVACSEVEIDCLTGDCRMLRTDIVMDVGTSLNPAVDIGQIEGGFIQGCGLILMEQIKYSPSGYKRSRGPRDYKIPNVGDIPLEMNVSLLKGSSNPRAIYSSKGVGEPALTLCCSVLFAIKDAIMAARKEAGIHSNFPFHVPATPEKIRMACVDQFTKQFPEADPSTYNPWFVTL